jgi:hypothetical protein
MFTTIVYSTETNSIKNSFVLTFILTFRFRHAKIRNANPENLKLSLFQNANFYYSTKNGFCNASWCTKFFF